ncbi:MAG: hypothetical protein JXB38_06365 [Anaerolineales bacterium]|nr:hypothetical protein [Anaerolineales bacterium]
MLNMIKRPARWLLLVLLLASACTSAPIAETPETPVPSSPTPPPATDPPPSTPTSEPTAYPTLTPTATLAPMGEVQPVTGDYAYLGDKDEMALGFNLNSGGSVGSLFWQGGELVDDSDNGRFIQISPYDGDDIYEAVGNDPYGNFGWNPLQSGSKAPMTNPVGGTILEFRRTEDTMYIKALAKEWGKLDQDSDTIYEVWAFLREGYFEVHVRATHIGTEYHITGSVEFPAAYFEFDLRDEYSYLGAAPFTGELLEELHYVAAPGELPGDPSCPSVIPTENWAAFARPDQTGLILAVPPQKYLSAYWAVCLLYDSPQVGYISPLAFFDFAPGDTREMTYYLIPGPIAEGRKIVYDLIPHTIWSFNLDTLEGWQTESTPASVADGVVVLALSPDNPLTSRPALNIQGRTAPTVSMRARVPEGEAMVCLEYLTLSESDWNPDRSACLTIAGDEFAKSDFNVGTLASWNENVITQLRLTAPEATQLELDSLIVNKTGHAWEFDSEADIFNWNALYNLKPLRVESGNLVLESLGDDPYLSLPANLAIDAATMPQIEIRMSVSAGHSAQVFFATGTDLDFIEEKSLVFEINADGQYHTYTLDMSTVDTWQGTVDQLRLDPTDAPGTVEVEYIRIR